MGGKGRMPLPPPQMRHPHPIPVMHHHHQHHPDLHFDMHHHHPHHPDPHFDMEHKLQVQHMELQRLATENHRLASTHSNLRKQLATAQHELQMLQSQIDAVKIEREQQMRSLIDKVSNMEADLKSAKPLKLELNQTREKAHNMAAVRHQLISQVQKLDQDLRRAHSDAQQIPSLVSELENLRHEYQHCRATYDYEKKLYSDHLESLQLMENNYMTMSREVEKLRSELNNSANLNGRLGGPYGGVTAGYNENEAFGNPPAVQNTYEDSYNAPPQAHAPLPVTGGVGPVAALTTYIGGQPGHIPGRPGYDAQRAQGYDPQRGPNYDTQRGPGYVAQRELGFEAQTGSSQDAQKGQGFNMQWGQGYEAQKGPIYDAAKGAGHELQYRGPVGAHNQVAPTNNMAYGMAPPHDLVRNGYEMQPRVGNPNPARR